MVVGSWPIAKQQKEQGGGGAMVPIQ